MNIWNKKSIPHVHNRINYFLNSETILYQDFNLTWGRKFPSWTASLIQGRDMFSKNVQGWKPENVKISPQKTNTSPPTATMFLSKFFPYPAPLHRPQADDGETGPYHAKTKELWGEGDNLFPRPFLVWMLPQPVSCYTWPFQLWETNPLDSWSPVAISPRFVYSLCADKSTSTQIIKAFSY